MRTNIYRGLDEDQLRAVTAPAGPVCVLAGAGTGKTRTITHRIAHLIATGAHRADEILAVTFTTRAASEMRTRLRALGAAGVQARTFHSAALKQLSFFWPRSVGGAMWPVLDHKMRHIAGAARALNLGTDTATLRDLAAEIEWAKACLIAPEDYLSAITTMKREPAIAGTDVARAYSRYEESKTAAQVLDFDDLLLHICAIVENDDDAARTFRARYRSFVVDEYQDVTPLQQRTLDAWLGGRDDVTVVGDANQTIYSFAGASPRYLLDFQTRHPQATVLRLQRDYRSTPQIIDLANRVIAESSGAAARMRLTLKAVIADGPEVSYTEHADEPAEAGAVAARIEQLVADGIAPADIAVLYRINAQSEVYEGALTAAGIPFTVRGGEQFFTRAEIRQAMTALRAASREVGLTDDGSGSTDDGSGAAQNGSGAGDATAPDRDGAALVEQARAVLETVGLSAVPPPPGALRDRWEALSALVSVAEQLASVDPAATLIDFVRELDVRAQSRHAPTVDGVTLASMHSAKGLEWEVVFLVGLAEGTVPIQYAQTPEAVEEERRLFYVGVTRARNRLELSWALARASGGRATRRRSRFLHRLAPSAPPRAAKRTRSGTCAVCGSPLTTADEKKLRRCANCPTTADPALYEALREWRRERSAAAKVPAYVVFTDLTLLAIAEARPASTAALRQIHGIGPTKLDQYGAEILQIVGATS